MKINLVIQCTMLKDQKPQSGIGQLEQKALEWFYFII